VDEGVLVDAPSESRPYNQPYPWCRVPLDFGEVLYNLFEWIKGKYKEDKDDVETLPEEENPWRAASRIYQSIYPQTDFSSQNYNPQRYCIIPGRFKYRTDKDVFYCCLKGKPHSRVSAKTLYCFIHQVKLELGHDFTAVMDCATLDTILSNIFVDLARRHEPNNVASDFPKMSYLCDERFFNLLTRLDSGLGIPSPQEFDRHFAGIHAQRLKQYLTTRNIITRSAMNDPNYDEDSNRYAPIDLLDYSKWATLFMPLYEEPLGIGIVVHLKSHTTMSYRLRKLTAFDRGITGIEKWLAKSISWSFRSAASHEGWTHSHHHVEIEWEEENEENVAQILTCVVGTAIAALPREAYEDSSVAWRHINEYVSAALRHYRLTLSYYAMCLLYSHTEPWTVSTEAATDISDNQVILYDEIADDYDEATFEMIHASAAALNDPSTQDRERRLVVEKVITADCPICLMPLSEQDEEGNEVLDAEGNPQLLEPDVCYNNKCNHLLHLKCCEQAYQADPIRNRGMFGHFFSRSLMCPSCRSYATWIRSDTTQPVRVRVEGYEEKRTVYGWHGVYWVNPAVNSHLVVKKGSVQICDPDVWMAYLHRIGRTDDPNLCLTEKDGYTKSVREYANKDLDYIYTMHPEHKSRSRQCHCCGSRHAFVDMVRNEACSCNIYYCRLCCIKTLLEHPGGKATCRGQNCDAIGCLQESISQNRVSSLWFREFWHLKRSTNPQSSQMVISNALKEQYLLTSQETRERYKQLQEDLKKRVFAELKRIKNQFPSDHQRQERDSQYQRYLFREALFSRLEAQQLIWAFNAHERKLKKREREKLERRVALFLATQETERANAAARQSATYAAGATTQAATGSQTTLNASRASSSGNTVAASTSAETTAAMTSTSTTTTAASARSSTTMTAASASNSGQSDHTSRQAQTSSTSRAPAPGEATSRTQGTTAAALVVRRSNRERRPPRRTDS
jgi:hypothetical protein